MKEYSFTITPTGLAKDVDAIEGAVLLRNLVPDSGFWRVPRVPIIPTGWTSGTQVFRGRTATVFCTPTTVGILSEPSLTVTPLTSVPSGGAWCFADFGPVWLAANGSRLVGMFPTEPSGFRTINQASPHFGVVACHNDTRLIYGDCTLGQNWVGWSCIGGEDIPYLLYGVAPPTSLLQLNESGQAPMPFRGRILAIRPLRDRVMVYGEDGVIALRPVGTGYGLEDVRGIPPGVGIAGRAAVDGNVDKHLFVGTDGALYSVGANLDATRIETVVAVPTTPTVVWNGTDGEFWVSGTADSLVVTEAGVGGLVEAVVKSIALVPGLGLRACGTGYPDLLRAELWTNMVDAGGAEQKKLTYIRVAGDGLTKLRVGAKVRHMTGAALVQSPYVQCSPEGAGYLNTVMVSGQIGVAATVSPGSRIWGVEVRYQAHDRRFIRGTRGIPKEE